MVRARSEGGADSLAGRMRERAKTDNTHSFELIDKAAKLEAASAGFFSEKQTHSAQQLLGSWARARRLWCDLTGESVI
jgi:hypothetical protein